MTCLTFDVGGTYIKHALIKNGVISQWGRINTPASGAVGHENSQEELFPKLYDQYLGEIFRIFSRYGDGIDGIAMSVPGILDAKTGYMYTGGSLKYVQELNLAEAVSDMCGGIKVTIENDAKAAATAELISGSLRGVNNAAVVLCGTGIGGCTICDGKIVRGSHFFAGEYSFIYIGGSPKEKRFWGEAAGVHRMYEEYAAKKSVPLEIVTGEYLFDRANAGDSVAISAVRNFCTKLCGPICNLQTIIDTERIAIGGGISNQPLFLDILREQIEIFSNDYYAGFPKPVVVPCKYRNSANLLGAYYRFCSDFKNIGVPTGEAAKEMEVQYERA